MRYIADHDFHIHSMLSSCSRDPEQNTKAILAYAEANQLKHICLTDHFWDSAVPGASKWYQPQNFEHISQALPLPQSEHVCFHFGCETDMDKFYTVGVSDKVLDRLEFIIIPTTHLHMKGFTIDEKDSSVERRAYLYVERFRQLLNKDLPFHKVGLAHSTCSLMAPGVDGQPSRYLEVLGLVEDNTFRELWKETAKKGMGVELNFPIEKYDEETRRQVLRPYKIAKACGCKFYLGSDAHKPKDLEGAKQRFEMIADALELEESDKFLVW